MALRPRANNDLPLPFLLSFIVTSVLLCSVLVAAAGSNARWNRIETTVTEEFAGLRTIIDTLRVELLNRSGDVALQEQERVSFGFEKGVVFAVAFPHQGDLRTNEGICPDASHSPWLQHFKKAILACAALDTEPLKLTVKGYASVAPVKQKDSKTDISKFGNLEIANRRGFAVANFLASSHETFRPEECKTAVSRFMCDGTTMPDGACHLKKRNYIVQFEPWQNYDQLRERVTMDDGGRPNPRREFIEFLNRTVHIVVENNACERCPQASPRITP